MPEGEGILPTRDEVDDGGQLLGPVNTPRQELQVTTTPPWGEHGTLAGTPSAFT